MTGSVSPQPRSGWTLSPYPAPFRFAFTIIHDADSGYSQRLAPIFDCFDELGLSVTATVFPFWAAWSDEGRIWEEWLRDDPYFAPVAVPLEDATELEFYRDLAARGHEIAMHTPSETSSIREQLHEAFAFFEKAFGTPPRMYVEHSPGNNLDAQQRLGADPTSPYYNTDVLNESGCWIWVLDHVDGGRPRQKSTINLLEQPDAPFAPLARDLYGIARGFLRTGHKKANGDTFIEQFGLDAIDKLEADGGLSLYYTHLNYAWLDPETRQVRAPVRERLEHMASKAGWFATGSDILDRFAAMRDVFLSDGDGWVKVVNAGPVPVESVVLGDNAGGGLTEGGVALPRTPDGGVVIERLDPYQTRTLFKS